MKLKLKAPAKINLGLSILGKLPNGYHRVKTIYTQVGLFDLIELEDIKEDKIDFKDKSNLVWQAANLIKTKYKVKKGVRIVLEKKIPAGAGLGGGSSDAAVVLKGLNKLWQLNLSEKELINLGKKLGSDVAYQIIGGTKMETQGGSEAGKFVNMGKVVDGFIVVCVPKIFISSKEAYSQVEYDKIGKNEVLWHNDFEIWTFKQYPQIKKIKETMIKSKAEKSLMSGKGAAVFGVFKDKKTAIICRDKLKKQDNQIFIAKSL